MFLEKNFTTPMEGIGFTRGRRGQLPNFPGERTLSLCLYIQVIVSSWQLKWEKKSTVMFLPWSCISLAFRPRTFSTISTWLEQLKNLLIYCRIQQKVRKYMKLTKFGILVKKTTYLSLSKEIAIFPWGVENNGNSRGECI